MTATRPQLPDAPVRIRARMPIRQKASLVITLPDGRIGELTLLWLPRARWERRPESGDSRWMSWGVGPFVLGVRVEW